MLETADGPHDHAHRASWANLRGPSRYLAACVAATRPKSLTAAVIPFAVGTSLACAAGPPRWPHAVPAFAAFVLMQVGCNLVNDACDFTRGADGPRRTGPTRVSQAGVFRPGTVHLFGVLTLALSLVAMVPAALDFEYEGGLVFVGSDRANSPLDRIQWAVVLLAVSSTAAAYAYTGGPYPLGYHALGEATVFFFFGVVAVALARRAHLKPPKCEGARSVTHSETHGVFVPSFGFDMSCVTRDLRHTLFDHDALVAGAQTGALACVLLAVNNLRDLNTDAAANKNTLAVRYGVAFVKAEIDALMAVAFLCTWYWWFTRVGIHVSGVVAAETKAIKNWSYASTAPCLAIPLALSVSRRARALEPGHRDCDAVLAAAAALHFAFGGLLALGIWLDARSF
jgi:1,4-dihydroxy-2-naphthoate octaprenyltransferase